jgi:hypothetical protein
MNTRCTTSGSSAYLVLRFFGDKGGTAEANPQKRNAAVKPPITIKLAFDDRFGIMFNTNYPVLLQRQTTAATGKNTA